MERRALPFVYLFLGVVLLAAVSESPDSWIPAAPSLNPLLIGPPSGAGAAGKTDELVTAHNFARVSRGLRPLARNAKLVAAARKHAEHMAAKRTLAHMGIGDGNPWDRIAREGYRYANASENAAWNQATVPQVMNDWLHSPGHRAAILGPYTEMGAYVAYDREKFPYWCAVFATPLK